MAHIGADIHRIHFILVGSLLLPFIIVSGQRLKPRLRGPPGP